MTARHSHPAGEVRRIHVECAHLEDNYLGDPVRRAIDVWTPHGEIGKGLPLLISLAGYTGSGLSHTAWKNFGENIPERLDRIHGEGRLKPCVVAFPDCFTRLGGNQYVNSSVMGAWEDVLIKDMVPAIEREFSCGGEGRRALFGKSSGGYGAIVHAMKHANFWAGAACHAGDMAFELAYLAMMAKILRTVARAGEIEDFLTEFEDNDRPSGDQIEALMILAMAASYDPDPKSPRGIRLPVDTHTCEVDEERWAQWKSWDPLELAERHGEDLKRLKALFIDCGRQDQYDLLYGARRLTRKLTAMDVPHRYEEFEGTHSGIDHRLEVSLPFLVEKLS